MRLVEEPPREKGDGARQTPEVSPEETGKKVDKQLDKAMDAQAKAPTPGASLEKEAIQKRAKELQAILDNDYSISSVKRMQIKKELNSLKSKLN